MSNIVNLRTMRKRKAREDARKAADANAAQHGESKAARRGRETTQQNAERALDGHRRDPASSDAGAARGRAIASEIGRESGRKTEPRTERKAGPATGRETGDES